ARGGVRGVDDCDAVARDQFLGAADSAERGHSAGGAGVGTNLLAAIRKPPVTPAGERDALVIVPTFNERDNLPTLIAGLMAHPNVRVLVVDDRSPDGTGDLAEALAAEHRGRIDVLHRMERPGLGRS